MKTQSSNYWVLAQKTMHIGLESKLLFQSFVVETFISSLVVRGVGKCLACFCFEDLGKQNGFALCTYVGRVIMLKWDIRNASALIPIKTLYFFISLNNVQAFQKHFSNINQKVFFVLLHDSVIPGPQIRMNITNYIEHQLINIKGLYIENFDIPLFTLDLTD